MSHVNDVVQCPGCLDKFNAYPGFYSPLKEWFFSMRTKDKTFHCADAGRGKVDQEAYYARGASKAHFGESAHNWNIAIDTFFQIDGNYIVANSLYMALLQGLDLNKSSIVWYGAPDSAFKETPHFEWSSWRALRDGGFLTLVEPLS